MPTKMWFGNEQKMQWVPDPATGMEANPVGIDAQMEYANGRKGLTRTMQTHLEFGMNFPVQEAAGLQGLDTFTKYAQGFYGDCDSYPMFFADKMHYDQNLMPYGWSAPGMFRRGWASIADWKPRAYSNVARNPSVEIDTTNWADVDGTGGVASGARQLVGSTAVAGRYSYRVTWSTGTSAVSGGFNYTGTPILVAQTYDYSVIVKSIKTQRLQLTVNFRDAGNGSLSTVTGTQTVVTGNTQTELSIQDVVTPASTVTVDLEVRAVSGTSGSNWSASDWLEGDAVKINFSAAKYAGYFDGDTPGATWLGAAHASGSQLYVMRNVPTITDTPANSFNLPPVQATFNLISGTNAYPTVADTFGEIPYALIPIPPGYTLWLGASGSATGTGQIVALGYNTPAVQSTPVSTTVLTLLSSTGSTRLNTSINNVEFVKIFLRRTSTAVSTITLSAIMAQLWPTGVTPTLTGNFIEGKGHRGLKFVGIPTPSSYVLVDPNSPGGTRHLKGMSTTLIEAQDRG